MAAIGDSLANRGRSMVRRILAAAALAAAPVGTCPAQATQVWLQLSGDGYLYNELGVGPGFTFTVTVAYDPSQTSGPIALVASPSFTLVSGYGNQSSTKTYNLSDGSGYISIAPPSTLYDPGGGPVVNISAKSDDAYLGLSFLPFGGPFDQTKYNLHSYNGAGSVYADGEGYSIEELFVTRAVAVPEPVTWGMMTLGIGIVGAALRTRRRRVLVIA